MNSTIEQTIVNMCVLNPAVKRGDFINMFSWNTRDVQSVKNTIDGIDRAIAEISDGILYDERVTTEENCTHAKKTIETLEDAKKYFEHVVEYIESWTTKRFS